jgi:hypothetical protein
MHLRIRFIISIAFLFSAIAGAQEFELLTPRVMDFGTVLQDSIIKGKIQFKNSGDSPMIIARVHTSCGCTAANLDKLEYQSGDIGEVDVQFNTKGFSGAVRKYVTITLTEGQPASTRIVLQAQIKTSIQIEPAFIDLQNILLEENENERFILVTNNMDDPLIVEEIKTNIKNLEIDLKSVTLKPGSTEKIKVVYIPSRLGRNDGYIDIVINNPLNTVKRIPVFINVKNNAGN